MLILEYVLKVILAMLALGFGGCVVLFMGAAFAEFKNRSAGENFTWFCIVVSIFSALMIVLFIWLITIGWWA